MTMRWESVPKVETAVYLSDDGQALVVLRCPDHSPPVHWQYGPVASEDAADVAAANLKALHLLNYHHEDQIERREWTSATTKA